ncbi:MAG: hypothetical protein DWH73_03175 [Planctomycetota bacterium]|nr:MAG: hypothetical protein DWH73_03175 [Planctomycetota bacterium]
MLHKQSEAKTRVAIDGFLKAGWIIAELAPRHSVKGFYGLTSVLDNTVLPTDRQIANRFQNLSGKRF